MKIRLIFIFFLPFLLFNCNKKGDKYYFNGEIVFVDSDTVPSSRVEGKLIELDSVYAGYMSVYDSLICFITTSYPDYLMYVFNLNSSKLAGKFLPKGNGPDDFLHFGHTEQYDMASNSINLWGNSRYSGKILHLNLNRSITEQKTVIDSTLICDWKKEWSMPFGYIFVFENGNILASQPQTKIVSEYVPVKYHLYDSSGEKLKSYEIYYTPIFTKYFPPENYYYSTDRLKPDKTKIVMAMEMLGQINLLNLTTNKIQGVRLKNTPDFNDLARQSENFRIYYIDVCTDKDFIFALYSGVPMFTNGEISYPFACNVIHVFDWNGTLMRKIILDHKTANITFDPVKKQLYSLDEEDNLYGYDFSGLYSLEKL